MPVWLPVEVGVPVRLPLEDGVPVRLPLEDGVPVRLSLGDCVPLPVPVPLRVAVPVEGAVPEGDVEAPIDKLAVLLEVPEGVVEAVEEAVEEGEALTVVEPVLLGEGVPEWRERDGGWDKIVMGLVYTSFYKCTHRCGPTHGCTNV